MKEEKNVWKRGLKSELIFEPVPFDIGFCYQVGY